MGENKIDELVDKLAKEVLESSKQKEEGLKKPIDQTSEDQEKFLYNSIITEPVESSNIESIGYLKESKILKIVFKGGSSYIYKNVEELQLKNIQNAKSIGRYFNDNIKAFPDKYECIKL